MNPTLEELVIRYGLVVGGLVFQRNNLMLSVWNDIANKIPNNFDVVDNLTQYIILEISGEPGII